MIDNSASPYAPEIQKQQTAEQWLKQALNTKGKAAFVLFEQAKQQAKLESNYLLEGQALLAEGKLYRDNGELNAALICFDNAFDLAQENKDMLLEGDALNQRASINHLKGDYALAARDIQQVLIIARAANDTERITNYLMNLGILSTKLADYDLALKSLTEAHKLTREKLSSPLIEGQCLINIGLLYEDMGDNESALDACQQALEKLTQIGNKQGQAIATVNLGYAHKRLGHLNLSILKFQDARNLAQEINFPKVEIAAIEGYAEVLSMQGQHQQAIALHEEALQKSKDSEDFEGELDALSHLARVFLELGKPKEAQEKLYICLKLAESAGRKKTLIEVHELLTETYEQQGKFSKAIEHLKLFHHLDKALFNEENRQKTRQLAIRFDLERAKHEADVYRLHSEFEREAKEKAEAIVKTRTKELEQSCATIEKQNNELAAQVTHLNQLLAQNESLRQELMQASRRNVALNERTLRRLSAELHDGPAQDLGFVLLKLESGELAKTAQTLKDAERNRYDKELERLQTSLQRALSEMRAVATDMCLPELEHLSLADVVKRVVRKHQRRTQARVNLTLQTHEALVALPVKITIHRVIQEALTNAFKHSGVKEHSVELTSHPAQLRLKIKDKGLGFDLDKLEEGNFDHLGVLGMRERITSLGGSFGLKSELGEGTLIEVSLPLNLNEKLA